jgi:hypothetical protein
MSEPDRVDFAKLIAELEAAGITAYKIALMMRRRIDKVIRWKKGQEPKHYEGQMLLMIHGEYVSRETNTENGPSVSDFSMTRA